jgi:hypothetical protein
MAPNVPTPDSEPLESSRTDAQVPQQLTFPDTAPLAIVSASPSNESQAQESDLVLTPELLGAIQAPSAELNQASNILVHEENINVQEATPLAAPSPSSQINSQDQEPELALTTAPLRSTEASFSEANQISNITACSNSNVSSNVTAEDGVTTSEGHVPVIQGNNTNSGSAQSRAREGMIAAIADMVVDTVDANELHVAGDQWRQGQVGMRRYINPPSRRDLLRFVDQPAAYNPFRILPPGNPELVALGSTPVDVTAVLQEAQADMDRRLRRLPPYDYLNDPPANRSEVSVPDSDWEHDFLRDVRPPVINFRHRGQAVARQTRESSVVPPRSTAVGELR